MNLMSLAGQTGHVCQFHPLVTERRRLWLPAPGGVFSLMDTQKTDVERDPPQWKWSSIPAAAQGRWPPQPDEHTPGTVRGFLTSSDSFHFPPCWKLAPESPSLMEIKSSAFSEERGTAFCGGPLTLKVMPDSILLMGILAQYLIWSFFDYCTWSGCHSHMCSPSQGIQFTSSVKPSWVPTLSTQHLHVLQMSVYHCCLFLFGLKTWPCGNNKRNDPPASC